VAGDASGVLYKEVPYPGNPLHQTHPDRLATLAQLYGLAPAPPAICASAKKYTKCHGA